MRRVALLAALAILAGCASESAERAALAPADAVLRAVDLQSRSPDTGFAQLNAFALEEPALAARAAAELVDAEEDAQRYTAVYVLGLTASRPAEIEALRAAMGDTQEHIRLTAAGALIGLGERRAIPELIRFLENPSPLPGSTVRMSSLAQDGLEAYVGEEPGDQPGGWSAWWEEHGDDLRWDPDQQRYES